MFNSDLDVLARLGYPLTAQRIRDAIGHTANADNVIEWAFDHGYTLVKHMGNPVLSQKYNDDNRWSVSRACPPYADMSRHAPRYGKTAKEAIEAYYDSLLALRTSYGVSNESQQTLIKPFWMK
jgi:hypothetical protein